MIEISLNGACHKIDGNSNLMSLLEGLDLDTSKVAVERNLEIVPKSTYQNIKLVAGDRLEIVNFIGGG